MSRAEHKLSYAEIHIKELRDYHNSTSNDVWENAHQESVFFHLTGAVEGLLHEINKGYSLGLALDEVTYGAIRKKIAGKTSPAFDYLHQLRWDNSSWLSLLYEWRNHGGHREHIGKHVVLSTRRQIDNEFTDPRTPGQLQTAYPGLKCQEVLERLSTEVRDLITHCRKIDPSL